MLLLVSAWEREMDVGAGREGLGEETSHWQELSRYRRAQMPRELRIETALRAACQAGSLELQCLIGFLWGGDSLLLIDTIAL